MKKFLIVFLVFVISGCANTTEFAKNIKSEDLLFDPDKFKSLVINGDKEIYAKNIGRDKSGFIEPDLSSERLDFEKRYPVKESSDLDYKILDGFSYNIKLGQVLRLSADLDKRTSGVLRAENGTPFSISGMMKIETSPIIMGAGSAGASQAIAAGVSSNSLINPALSSGANIAMGLGAGLIAGIIENVRIKNAIDGIIAKPDFGSRMEEATSSGYAPVAQKINSLGFYSNNSHVLIAPGLVKSMHIVVGQKNIQYKHNVFLISAVGVFRGEDYKSKFPETKGWEFRITNLNRVEANMDLGGESLFLELRGALKNKNIKL